MCTFEKDTDEILINLMEDKVDECKQEIVKIKQLEEKLRRDRNRVRVECEN